MRLHILQLQALLLTIFFIGVTNCQNPILGIADAFARARNAFRLLELDVIYLNLPYGGRDVKEVTFSLFTAKNPSNGQSLVLNDSLSISASNFQSQRPTKILIHGYTQNLGSLDFPQGIKNAYLGKNSLNSSNGYNIICVDWSVLSKEVIYFDSANYTTIAGNRIGEFLGFLKSNGFIRSYMDIHLIGFSLGAHVAGVVGEYVQQLGVGAEKIGRITGLDPAGPGFSSVPRSHRLDREDAHFVDVIHSNMGSILTGDLGSTMLHGHADFYPNGGRRQPGCEYSVFREYSIPRKSSCSHLKAAEYFENSIRRVNKYVATKCENWGHFQSGICANEIERHGKINPIKAIMGENCNPETRGKFYLYTNK